MSDIAIRVESLSKAYRIGLKEQQHETMLGAMAAWVKSPLRNFREVRNLSRLEDANVEDRRSKIGETSMMKFEDLEAWQGARSLTKQVYDLT